MQKAFDMTTYPENFPLDSPGALRPEGINLAKQYRSRWKSILYMIKRLPSILFWGVRISDISARHCTVAIPYRWTTQNPFRSIYFAAMAGAAELSTGALCQIHLAGRGRWSMLVTEMKMEYLKKAKSTIVFTCKDGDSLAGLLDQIEKSGQPDSMTMISSGSDHLGVAVAKLYITWSFKKK